MEKTIIIDGKPVKFSASAATPRHYRNLFVRDMIADMDMLTKSFASKEMPIYSLQVFEDMAYVMAKSGSDGDPNFPETPDEWLEQFEGMSIYSIFPQLLELWNMNQKTLVSHKKKQRRRRAR